MSDARDRARAQVIRYCRRLQAEHLVHATAGNVSVRVDGERDVLAMTPTAVPYDELQPADVCLVDAGGRLVDGRHAPSSELPLHTLLYARRPEIGAIVHTHSPAATTMAALGWALPAILTGLVGAVGGDVRVAAYGRPGTAAMADLTVAAIEDRGACLLRHHGVVAVGADLAHAFAAAAATEAAADVYLRARAHAADVAELAPGEVAEIARAWHAQWE